MREKGEEGKGEGGKAPQSTPECTAIRHPPSATKSLDRPEK